MAAQRDQGDDTSMEGDSVTLGYSSNDDDTVKATKDEKQGQQEEVLG